MGNQKFDWETIMRDSATVMAECIVRNISISTIPQLYERLKVKYKKENKIIPQQNTYRQELHKRLNLQHNQRMVKSALYQLAGAYDRLSLEMLADRATVVSAANVSNSCWLFIRLTAVTDIGYTDRQKHLYHLSHKLKEQFRAEIQFISFDTDTLVILCNDNNASQAIASYINQCNNSQNNTQEREV